MSGIQQLLIQAVSSSAPSDPNWSSVVALLHMDGANNSTTITDSTGKHTYAVAGSCVISTAQSKFGGASAHYSDVGSSSDTISQSDSASADFQLGTGSFTIEGQAYFQTLQTCCFLSDTVRGKYIQYDNTAHQLNFHIGGSTYSFSWAPSINTWYHFAVCRSGTSLRSFIAGTQIGSTQTSSDNDSGIHQIIIGSLDKSPVLQAIRGYIDEVRITKGVARYTANFTPPANSFPNQ